MGEEQLRHLTSSPQSRQRVSGASPLRAANTKVCDPLAEFFSISCKTSSDTALNSSFFLRLFLRSNNLFSVSPGIRHFTFSKFPTSPFLFLCKVSNLRRESPKIILEPL